MRAFASVVPDGEVPVLFLAEGEAVLRTALVDFLSVEEKAVFKTFSEIAPLVIVQQAGARQKYIDQAQSLNILIHPDVPAKDVNALIIEGWKLGVKTFYYQRSANPAQELVRDIMNCAACEA